MRSIIIGIAAVIGLAGSVAAASGGGEKIESTISYRNSVEGFDFVHKGRVRSELAACERGRNVKLFAEEQEGKFGSDRTDETGRYRIVLPGDGIATDYYTRIKTVEKAGVFCLGAESEHDGFR